MVYASTALTTAAAYIVVDIPRKSDYIGKEHAGLYHRLGYSLAFCNHMELPDSMIARIELSSSETGLEGQQVGLHVV